MQPTGLQPANSGSIRANTPPPSPTELDRRSSSSAGASPLAVRTGGARSDPASGAQQIFAEATRSLQSKMPGATTTQAARSEQPENAELASTLSTFEKISDAECVKIGNDISNRGLGVISIDEGDRKAMLSLLNKKGGPVGTFDKALDVKSDTVFANKLNEVAEKILNAVSPKEDGSAKSLQPKQMQLFVVDDGSPSANWHKDRNTYSLVMTTTLSDDAPQTEYVEKGDSDKLNRSDEERTPRFTPGDNFDPAVHSKQAQPNQIMVYMPAGDGAEGNDNGLIHRSPVNDTGEDRAIAVFRFK